MSGTWKWVRRHDRGERLYDVGVKPDGTLHNPNNYPEDVVRTAVAAADARRHEKRSRAAKKAAVTKAERRDKKIYAIVQRLADGGAFKPGSYCEICPQGTH